MPMFVHWKWDEKQQDFTAIFHFNNESTNPDPPIDRIGFEFTGIEGMCGYTSIHSNQHSIPTSVLEVLKGNVGAKPDKIRATIAWTPSHIELALFTEILRFANAVNELKLDNKRELRDKLQLSSFFEGIINWYKRSEEGVYEDWKDAVFNYSEGFSNVLDRLQDREVLISSELSSDRSRLDQFICFPVCQEYVDYLKEILKPYLEKTRE